MKKMTAMLLTVLMVISLAACAGGKEPAEEGTSGAGTVTEKASAENTPPEDKSETEGTDILVAYFSATNTTEGVAKKIADSLSADLYEIIPEQPYTDEDLDYHDDNSRSTIEMNDNSARPAISGSVEDMEQYSIVFLGYPIWWGDAPHIVYSLVENVSLKKKTVIPFSTPISSGLGNSGKHLKARAQISSKTKWLKGRNFYDIPSQKTVDNCVKGIEY